MRSRKLNLTRSALWLASVLLIVPVSVYAQGVILDVERLEDWFYSRLVWGAVIGLISGSLVGAFHLCRLEFPINALHINGLARRRFGLWLILLFIIGGILLLLDAWLLYPFGTASLTLSDAFVQVWLNYRTLLVLLTTVAASSAAVAVTTRITPGSHCPFAFLPGPRGR